MSLKKFAERLSRLGCVVKVIDDKIELDIEEHKFKITFDADWLRNISNFYRARQLSYDSERRVLVANRFAEYHLTRLDLGFIFNNEHKFKDSKGCEVLVGRASDEFVLSFFESERYEMIFTRIKDRIGRRHDMQRRRGENRISLRPNDFLIRPHTARFTVPRKPRNNTVDKIATDRIRACLFSLACIKGECWEISYDIKSRGLLYRQYEEPDDIEISIPQATYESSIVSYYKVAKSSHFPSQIFLSYYHILEYFFLQVADQTLFSAVRARLNDPTFIPNYDNVSRLIATIKRNDNTDDEKKMLRDVLKKYVPEEDYIEFVKDLEERKGEKLVTGSKQRIFGEQFTIKLEKGHALANTASLLKHIRNALVHSSDRYSREDCYLPFSESEEIFVKYIPLVQFMAEKVIYATAKC